MNIFDEQALRVMGEITKQEGFNGLLEFNANYNSHIGKKCWSAR